MTRFQMCFPIKIGPIISPFLNRLFYYYSKLATRMLMKKIKWAVKVHDGVHTSICSGVHISRSIDFTLLICVPIPRWIPEHRMQRNTPLACPSVFLTLMTLNMWPPTDSRTPIGGLHVIFSENKFMEVRFFRNPRREKIRSLTHRFVYNLHKLCFQVF